jgi:hypothetical protein
MLHEHAAALSAAGRANRSRCLIKCAKDSGHYPPTHSVEPAKTVAPKTTRGKTAKVTKKKR